jgi:hypothetical protein
MFLKTYYIKSKQREDILYKNFKIKNNEDMIESISFRDIIDKNNNNKQSTVRGEINKKTIKTKKMKKRNNDLLASDYLVSVKSHLGKKLISQKNFDYIYTIAHHFPGNLTNFMILECHLGKKVSPKVDWAFAVSCKQKNRENLANFLAEINLPETFWVIPAWCKIGDFVAEWTNPNSVLYNNINAFWFEFDTQISLPTITPTPSVFIGPAHINGGSAHNNNQNKWLIHNALPLLMGKCLPKSIEQQLLECIQKMPKEASVFQIGTMLSRSTSGIRICIKRLHPKKIVSYLNDIGWTDNTGAFESLITELSEKVNRIVLNFNVDDIIGPSIGIECSFSPNQFQRENKWSNFLNYLVEKDLCSNNKRITLSEFPGIEHGKIYSINRQNPTSTFSNSHEEEFSDSIVRYINHIKLVYRPNKPIETKAYLAVRHFLLPRN